MATAQVKLYKDCLITPEKNFMVEDVDRYLLSLTVTTMNNFQYIKQDRVVTLKIATESFRTTAEDMLDPGETTNRFNYCSIKNTTDTNPFYYFVTDVEWRANKTLILTLLLDSVNTFKLGTDYQLTKFTKVLREHKDRIYNSTITVDGYKYYRRKIDFDSEGLTPVLYKNKEYTVREREADLDWYIMYKADNVQNTQFPPQPVTPYIMANRSIEVAGSYVGGYTLGIASMVENYRYYFGTKLLETPHDKITIDGTEYSIPGVASVRKQGSNVILEQVTDQQIEEYLQVNTIDTTTTSGTITFSTPGILIGVADFMTVAHGNYSDVELRIRSKKLTELDLESSGSATSIDSIFSVDRADTTLIKIIKLPYCPFQLVYDSNDDLMVPDYLERKAVNWTTSGGGVVTKNYLAVKSSKSGAFQNRLNIDAKVFENLFTRILVNNDVRTDSNESKLYHSDYYCNKFVYDSFSYPIQYENIGENRVKSMSPENDLEVNFVTTSTINSNFLFDFKQVADYRNTEDYSGILTVSRNNEIPIYNSEYINYLKNGYNYDVKARNANRVKGAFGIAGGAISTLAGGYNLAASVAGNVFTQDLLNEGWRYDEILAGKKAAKHGSISFEPSNLFDISSISAMKNPLSAVFATQQFVSGISGVTNSIIGIVQSEQAFKQKQEQMKMSSVSVEGSDDIDLLGYYSENRAKICEFKVSDKLRRGLADLFYYYGYINDETKVPDVHTRKWFNYLQCEADIKTLSNVERPYIDDLKDRFAKGVTIMHHNGSAWDFNQEFANNEVWLYN